MDGVVLTPLKQIYHPKGDIFHAMKKSDIGFDGFGEAYFSTINQNDIKGWKKHTKMTLNIVVPVGNIEFVVYDENSTILKLPISPEREGTKNTQPYVKEFIDKATKDGEGLVPYEQVVKDKPSRPKFNFPDGAYFHVKVVRNIVSPLHSFKI